MQLKNVALIAALAPTLALGVSVQAAAQEERTLPKVTAQDDGATVPTRTATKTDTPLIDVPQAISVIDAQRIEDQAMRSMADVALYVPGLSMGQGEGHRDAPTLRGNASTADFFVDGVRDDVQYYRDFYNVERLEVLKGPNAMIFGRGGGGGVINRVTKQADWEQRLNFSLQGGSFDYKRATVDVGAGLNDALAVRLTAMYEDSESYRDFVELERYGVNPTLTWAITPNTVLSVGAEHFDDHRVVDRGVPSQNGRPFETHESTFFGNPEQSYADLTATVGRANFEHNFGNGVRLRNHLSYGDYDKFYSNVHAGGAVTLTGDVNLQAYASRAERQNLFNQTDLTWAFNTGSVGHTLLIGAEIGRQSTDNFRTANGAAGSVNVNVATVSFVPVNLNSTQTLNTVDVDVLSAYVQDQLSFGDRWHLIAGLRFERFKMEFDDRRAANADANNTDNMVSPRVGVVYKPVENLSLYGSYSVSYLPQSGDQFASLSTTTPALDPEEFQNIEAGAKLELNSQLALSAAVFSLERSNTTAIDPVSSLTVLTGEQKSEGVELEVSGSLSENWEIAAGYSYQEAEITRTTTAAPAGRRVPLVPDHQASLWHSYRFSPMFRAALGIAYQSEVFASIGNSVRLPGFTRVDAALYADFSDNLSLQLNVENVLDRTYWSTAHNDNNITPGSPVAGRLTLQANF